MKHMIELLAQRISEKKSTLVDIDNCLFLISSSEELDKLLNIPKYVINNIEISTLYEIPPVIYWGTVNADTLMYMYDYVKFSKRCIFGIFTKGLYNLYQIEYIEDVFNWAVLNNGCETAIYYMGKPHVLLT